MLKAVVQAAGRNNKDPKWRGRTKRGGRRLGDLMAREAEPEESEMMF